MSKYSCDVFDPLVEDYCPNPVSYPDTTISANRWNERLMEMGNRVVPSSGANLCKMHYDLRSRLDDDGEVVMVYDRVEF